MTTPTMRLLEWAARRGPEAADHVGRALLLAQHVHQNQYRRNGDSYMEHSVSVALIVANGGADTDGVVAAVLHDLPRGPAPVSLDLLRHEFGDVVADLLDAFKELSRSSTVTWAAALDTVDPRVLHLKIAHRVHSMRTIDCFEPEKQCRKADQTRELVAPVARAIGLTEVAHELDTLTAATLRAHRPQQPAQSGGRVLQERARCTARCALVAPCYPRIDAPAFCRTGRASCTPPRTSLNGSTSP